VHDYLVSTNRPVSGEHHKRLEAGLDRLKGASIKTNITAGSMRVKHAFGLIDWKIIEKSPTNERMIAVEAALSEWLYNALRRAGCLIQDATDQRSQLRGGGGDGEATEYGDTQGIENGGG
jgi:plasmid replication initiation protein